ncbi:MAG: hypothetical protein KYX62_05485 [Pseudomonadota bacterium]|nr:hypothetical protein [Pseudomonadota bacterium]
MITYSLFAALLLGGALLLTLRRSGQRQLPQEVLLKKVDERMRRRR